MSTAKIVVRDERTVAVENAAFKWGYYILYFGLLLDCLYRHRLRHEGIGDLLVVLGVSVVFISVYLIGHKATERFTWRKFLIVYAFGWGWVMLFCASW
jgi:hypothetical protein